MDTALTPKIMTHFPVKLLLVGCFVFTTVAAAQEPIDFAHDILPLLLDKCAKCHTNGTYKAGLSMDTRGSVLDSGTIVPGRSEESELIARLTEDDPELRMPQGGKLDPNQIKLLTAWVDQGLPWEAGFSFKAKAYVAKLFLERPTLPEAVDGRLHPIDRIVDAYFTQNKITRPERSDDATFLRRVYLDLTGQLPDRDVLTSFLASQDEEKRSRVIRMLLSDPFAYADHWLSFWNDLLRNDYQGTGFIDGGRQQITSWLYESLLNNKPYDQFVRELVNPTAASEGFIKGIQWRGRVNASQVTPLQFAQNVSQVMLGINMKCASCHDSFINDWKLKDAYGLAAIVSDQPLEIHRCDKPTGEISRAAFIFPELGSIDSETPKQERLQQFAQLITSPSNGRLARTIVNRIWHRMMGRGIVNPVDIMSNPPWSEDLIDYLASDFVDHGFDLKRIMSQIASAEIYQAVSVPAEHEISEEDYRFRGPVARRMTAEQFQDAIWQLVGGGPTQAAVDFGFRGQRPVRASLVESSPLTRALGRPNREQVVTTRPAELTTLQALDLTNGDVLAAQLAEAGARLKAFPGGTAEGIVTDLYLRALSREPNDAELKTAILLLGDPAAEESVADLYWAVLMLPEFQMVR